VRATFVVAIPELIHEQATHYTLKERTISLPLAKKTLHAWWNLAHQKMLAKSCVHSVRRHPALFVALPNVIHPF